jgi:hypothetical protein
VRGSSALRVALSCFGPQSCIEPSADSRTARVVSECSKFQEMHPMAETERAKVLHEDAERLAELRRYL